MYRRIIYLQGISIIWSDQLRSDQLGSGRHMQLGSGRHRHTGTTWLIMYYKSWINKLAPKVQAKLWNNCIIDQNVIPADFSNR